MAFREVDTAEARRNGSLIRQRYAIGLELSALTQASVDPPGKAWTYAPPGGKFRRPGKGGNYDPYVPDWYPWEQDCPSAQSLDNYGRALKYHKEKIKSSEKQKIIPIKPPKDELAIELDKYWENKGPRVSFRHLHRTWQKIWRDVSSYKQEDGTKCPLSHSELEDPQEKQENDDAMAFLDGEDGADRRLGES